MKLIELLEAKPSEDRCTLVAANAILAHFHKPSALLDECPITGADLMDLLKQRGLTFGRVVDISLIRTLADVLKLLPKDKVFYIFSSGHAMAYIHGKLIDTNPTSTPSRRKISAIEVLSKS